MSLKIGTKINFSRTAKSLPREHRNTPWVEDFPRMQLWEKVAWAIVVGFFATLWLLYQGGLWK